MTASSFRRGQTAKVAGLPGIYLAVVFLFMTVPARAATNIWTGAGDWFADAGNWSNGVPGPGSNVLIASGSVLLTNATPLLGEFTMTNGTLTFSNLAAVVQATNVRITGGTVCHVTNSASATNASGEWPIDGRVYFACTNFFLGSSGVINVDGCGWGAIVSNAYGPGAGVIGSGRAGAGYGGFGANNANDGGGHTYGSAAAPDQPGSGGLHNQYPTAGGSGGGVVRIAADGGTVTINGTITANGKSSQTRGGGSGGGIWISCGTFAGTNGTIRANGQDTGPAGGANHAGGGGRIAIHYASVLQPATVTIKVSRGIAAPAYTYRGDIGTVYLSDASFLRETLDYIEGQIVGPWTFWGPANLTVSNNWVRFATDGFRLAVTNDLIIDGTNTLLELGGAFYMTNGCYLAYSDTMDGSGTLYYGYFQYGAATSALTCGGNLVLTNGARLRIYSGPTSETNACGALVDVKGDMVVGAGSWIHPVSHPTNGGSALFKMQNLYIATNAGFNATQVGYGGGGGARGLGHGPGGGGTNTTAGSGGGYGGTGGVYGAIAGGNTYGSSNAPVDPGSGGGRSGANTAIAYSGGSGGGLIRLEVGQIFILDGALMAKGRGIGWSAGAGAGGGINIRCRTLAGSGTLMADGGDAVTGGSGGAGGGGGRIAVWRMYDIFAGIASATGGPSSTAAYNGKDGTVVWGLLQFPGSVMSLQ